MRRDRAMIQTVVALTAICSLVQSSGVHTSHLTSFAPVASFASVAVGPPVVTSASSQYFERTFNRLVAAPVAPVVPVAPVAPIAPAPPVVVQPMTRIVPVAPTQNVPVEPNVAIAVATAHAAAPVATILLPPYRFAPPPTFGFVNPIVVPDVEPKKESTTTTVKEPEATTPIPSVASPSNTANAFAQALPSNQNTNVNQFYGPPLPQRPKPQKLKTSVEVEPVPLAYIAPPPLPFHHHHHHHHHHGHPVKLIHTFVPKREKLIPRPVHTVHTIRVPAKLVVHSAPAKVVLHRVQIPARNFARYPQKPLIRSRIDTRKDTEPTTFSPFKTPVSKPPKL